jgi:hypothetical protein
VEYVVIVAVIGLGVGVASAVLARIAKKMPPDRTVIVDGVTMTVRVGMDAENGIGTVIRAEHVSGPRLALMVAMVRSRLFVNVEPQDRVQLDDPEFEAIVHAWSNDLGLARWWLRSPVRERLMAAGGRWGFKIDEGGLEAHIHSTDAGITDALAACAAMVNRGAAFESELETARRSIADTGVALDVIRDESGAIMTRFDTLTRLVARRSPDQEPFALDPRLTGGTRHLYEQVKPARVEADEQTLRLDLEGIVFDADTLVRAAKLATRLAEPAVTPLEEGPYR